MKVKYYHIYSNGENSYAMTHASRERQWCTCLNMRLVMSYTHLMETFASNHSKIVCRDEGREETEINKGLGDFSNQCDSWRVAQVTIEAVATGW